MASRIVVNKAVTFTMPSSYGYVLCDTVSLQPGAYLLSDSLPPGTVTARAVPAWIAEVAGPSAAAGIVGIF
jgi:hypothetical protein